VNHENSGILSLTIGEEGDYKGKLVYAGVNYPVEGRFDPDGQARKMVVRTESQTLMLELKADIGKPDGHVKGTVRQAGMAVDFACDRMAPRATEATGRYTMLLVGVGTNPGPAGDGCATLSVTSEGVVNLAGSLSDGTAVEWSAAMHPEGRCPVYVPLYGGRGSLSGWLQFGGNKSGLDISGQLAWFKPEAAKEKIFPQGFSRLVAVAGNRYLPPATGGQLLAYTNAVVAFSEGNLPENLGSLLELEADGHIRVTVPTDNKFHFSLAPATGAFTGAFMHPATRKTVAYQGVVLQKHGWGSGHFSGPEQSGLVFFGPNKGLPEEKK
jgi:hypothetical protein